MLSDLFDQDAAFDAYIEAVKRELEDEHQKEKVELQNEKEELQNERVELKKQLNKNREADINKYIKLAINLKMPQEDIIQNLEKDFELSYEESKQRILSIIK